MMIMMMMMNTKWDNWARGFTFTFGVGIRLYLVQRCARPSLPLSFA